MRINISYCVYIHTNKINGKVYVGQTCQSVKERWKNGNGYKNNKHFYNSIIKYGWDNFEHEILFEDLTKDEADKKEIELIAYYDSTNPEKGYNLTKGGEGCIGYKHTDEAKEKMSKIHKGKKISDEQKAILLDVNIGNKYMLGKHHSEETKEKIAKKNSKSLMCIETGLVYLGTRDAERKTGISHSSISLNISGKYENAGGYHWKWCNAS